MNPKVPVGSNLPDMSPAVSFDSSYLPPNNITPNSANKRTGQCLSDFQTSIGATAYATLDIEQLISCYQICSC